MIEQNKETSRNDVVEVLSLVLERHGKALTVLHHAAIESEIERFHARQNRRLLLAQFMSGMMVGLGLLGTFVGLLGALNEIGKLIGSFSLGSGMTDPVAAVSELVTRLTEPMKAMGIAFSASLFGVLGSLIMSMLMVFIKSATVELVSMLQNKISWITELESQSQSGELLGLQSALSELATHSPVLEGLVVALDQSERRVRQVLTSVHELVAQMAFNTQAHADTAEKWGRVSEQQTESLKAVQGLQGNMSKMQEAFLLSSHNTQLLAQMASQQQSQLQTAMLQQILGS